MLSIITPSFNNGLLLKRLYKSIMNQSFKTIQWIIVDDGSTDGTSQLLEDNKNLYSYLHKNDHNQGKGAAVMIGLKNSSGHYVVIQDADLEYDPNDLLKFEEVFLKFNADGIIGSRFNYDKFTRSHSILNKIGNYILTLTFNILYNTTFTDIYSCYFAFKKELINANNLNVKGFAQHAEILTKIIIKGNKFYEVPINYNGRNTAEGKKIRFYHFFPVLFQILLGRFR